VDFSRQTTRREGVMLYRRGEVWWYKFRFAGRLFRESAKTTSKSLARQAERKRHQSLEEGIHGIKKRVAPVTFAVAAADWLKLKKPSLAAKSHRIEQVNIDKHLKPVFGSLLLIDVTADDIADYQKTRLKEKAAPKTINLEIGTLRAIFRRHRIWANLQPDVKMLAVRDDVGRALTAKEEVRLLAACRKSRSRALATIVTLAVNTGMRRGEIQALRWQQIDFLNEQLVVGHSKTAAGQGRGLPLNPAAFKALESWATTFPERKPEHFVFPAERYGVATNDAVPHTYSTKPEKPLKSFKEAWESAKKTSGVTCRFHDLRHSACTRLLERGVPLSVVASLLGWSAGTTVRMARRYGHISAESKRDAVLALMPHTPETEQGLPEAES
jgi:integrase